MKRAAAFVWLALLAAAGLPAAAAGAELKPIVLRPAAAPVLPLEEEWENSEPESGEPQDGKLENAEQPVLLPPPPVSPQVRRLATDLPTAAGEAAGDRGVQLASHQARVRPQRVFRLLGLASQAAQRSVLTSDAGVANPLRSERERSPALRSALDEPSSADTDKSSAPISASVRDDRRFEPMEAAAEEEWKTAPSALAESAAANEAGGPSEKIKPAAPLEIENTFVAGVEKPRPSAAPLRIPALLAEETIPPAQSPSAAAPSSPLQSTTGLAPFITSSRPAAQPIVNDTIRKEEPAAEKSPADEPETDEPPAEQTAAPEKTPPRAERARQLAAAQLQPESAWRPQGKEPELPAPPAAATETPAAADETTSLPALPSLAAAVPPAAEPPLKIAPAPRAAAPPENENAPVEQTPLVQPPAEPPAASLRPRPQRIAVWEAPQQPEPQPQVAPRQPEQEQQKRDPRDVALARFQNQDQAVPTALGPFEVIAEESEAIEVQVRRSKLLRTQFDIYRTAVVDAAICEVAQFTPREAAIIGKGEGATNVTFWFDGGQRPVTYLVRVKPDVEEVKKVESQYELLEKMLAQHFPDSKVSLTVIADKVLVKGQARDSEEAAQILAIVRNQANAGNVVAGNGGWTLGAGQAADVLGEDATGRQSRRQLQVINMLRVPGVQQVALRVKIAELNRSAARGFGVDISGPNDGPAIINFTDNPDGSALFLQSLLNVAAGNAPALLTQFDGDDIQIGIRYLQQHGVLRLLSEPTLVTLSGRPATFVAGGEFAVPTVVGSAGLNAVTTDFRAFGVIISFMPTVIDKDRIRLQVAPEFSQVNSDLTVNDTPGLNVRAVTTTVEMREGQTLAIAGLLEDTMSGTNTGDIPFLAKLLGRRNMSRNETELLILVTPELVQPMEPEETPPLPGFDVTEPTNGQFFLHGDLEGDPTSEYRSTVWPRLNKRYRAGGPAMISGPFGHGQ